LCFQFSIRGKVCCGAEAAETAGEGDDGFCGDEVVAKGEDVRAGGGGGGCGALAVEEEDAADGG